MATPGEGASAPTSSTYEGGGGGGKFSKRQFRKIRTTPYDRPATALRNPSWLSKLVVDPATKLISSSAQRFFASVFRKRLPPPPPAESNQNPSDGCQGAVQKNQGKAPETVHLDGKSLAGDATSSISELEQLLKHKTFSRSEIDCLTELLRSRAADSTFQNDTRANPPKMAMEFGNNQLLKSSIVENKTEKGRSHGTVLTRVTSARVLEEDIASPVELAKAYMGSRPLKISPSKLGLCGQAIKQDTSLLSTVPFYPKSPVMSLTTKTAAPLEVSENGFTTPRFRGRSAIYNMARTPYSRVHSTAFGKGSSSRSHFYDGYPLPSSTVQEGGDIGPYKMALKRRSSVLDDDIGTVGPMRRIRQKHNLLPNKFAAPPHGTEGVSGTAQLAPLTEKLSTIENLRQKGVKVVEENDYGTPSTSYTRIPPKSVETAAKIFQELERMTPREKSTESKLIAAREKSPTKLTTEMLCGPALRSLDKVEPLKLLQNIQDSQKLEADHHDFLQKQAIQENGLRKFEIQHDTTPIISDPTTSVKDVMPDVEASSSGTMLVTQHLQKKKRAFMMSAPEDYLELDDDTYSNGTVSQTLVEGSRKPNNSVMTVPVENQEKDRLPALTEINMTPPRPIFGRTDAERGNTTTADGENAAVVSPALCISTQASPPVTHPPLTSAFEKSGQAFDKIPTFETTRSTSSIQRTELPLEVPTTSKKDDNKVATKPIGKPETIPSVFSLSSFGSTPVSTIAENHNIKNVPLASGSSLFPFSTAAASASLANLPAADSISTAPSASNTASVSTMWAPATPSCSPILPTPVPSLSAAPISGSGPSHDAPIAAPSALSGPNIEVSTERKLDKEAKSHSFSDSLSSVTALAMSSTRNNIFGLNSSNASATATCDTSSISLQPFTGGSEAANFAQSMPVQFSCKPAFTFGSQGVASSGSSNSQFCSSTPGILSETKPLSSGSGASSSVFNLSVTSTPTSETATVGSTSGATTSTFKFCASSSAASSATTTVSSTGFSTPGMFSFGAISSSSNNMVSSNTGTSSGLFGKMSASSSSGPSAAFGSSWQSPVSSPFGSTFNSSPSTFFSVGTSTSSFSAANSAPMFFGSTTSVPSAPVFSTSSSPSPFPTQTLFGNSTSTFTTPAGNNDHISTEDSMAEDPVQSTTPNTPIFGQPPVPSPPFVFGTASQSSSPFQFGAKQNQGAPQNSSPLQASSSLGYAGGSFSLGSADVGGDKSGRKFIKANRNKHRKR